MFDPDDPYSGYRPDMDQYGNADPKSVRAAGLATFILVFVAYTTAVVLITVAVLT